MDQFRRMYRPVLRPTAPGGRTFEFARQLAAMEKTTKAGEKDRDALLPLKESASGTEIGNLKTSDTEAIECKQKPPNQLLSDCVSNNSEDILPLPLPRSNSSTRQGDSIANTANCVDLTNNEDTLDEFNDFGDLNADRQREITPTHHKQSTWTHTTPDSLTSPKANSAPMPNEARIEGNGTTPAPIAEIEATRTAEQVHKLHSLTDLDCRMHAHSLNTLTCSASRFSPRHNAPPGRDPARRRLAA